jgi:hypothetical protein
MHNGLATLLLLACRMRVALAVAQTEALVAGTWGLPHGSCEVVLSAQHIGPSCITLPAVRTSIVCAHAACMKRSSHTAQMALPSPPSQWRARTQQGELLHLLQ